ncbi:cytochrome C oxidase subunit II [Bhargavaea cecembensis]|nr:cytochrome C oxidase subunit II [Bhargavaea cecembensis]
MKNKKNPHEADLRGTLISVLTVGILIAVMWFAVYAMYVAL